MYSGITLRFLDLREAERLARKDAKRVVNLLRVVPEQPRPDKEIRADAAERQNWELLGDGEGIHWPAVDEDLSVAGLLAGARSQSRPLRRAG